MNWSSPGNSVGSPPAVAAAPAVPGLSGLQTTPLRIAFCLDNLNIGGTELNAFRTASHLVNRGVELSVFTLSGQGPLRERYEALGIPVEAIEISRLVGFGTVQAGQRLARRLREQQVHVLHAHDLYSNIFAAPWARFAGVGFIASRRWWEWPDRPLQRWANRAAYAFAHRVLVNAETLGQLMIAEELVPSHSVRVVRNFLDDVAFAPPPEGWVAAAARSLDLPERRLVIGVVASLSPVKDHATLLRAVARLHRTHPHLMVVLVGRDAGAQSSLVDLAHHLGIERQVRFAGQQPSQPSYHHLFDVSALTSQSEGLPNSLLEAMAAGRPVVATDVGAVADAVRHGETGLLARPGDPIGLANALDQLLSDGDLREYYGRAGRARVIREFSAGTAIDQLMALYHDLAVAR